jgi:hypothetical protein
MLRSIKGDTVLDHRSSIMQWQGGLVAHMEVDRFIAQSLHWAVVRMRDPGFMGGRYSKDQFEPASSLSVIFNPPEPQTPTPMSAAPVSE